MHLVLALVAVFALSACAAPASLQPASPISPGPDVVGLSGVHDVRFGATRAALDGRITDPEGGCNAQLLDQPNASLVFAADQRFVLLWFDAPLRTPEGVGTGSSLAEATAAYPRATQLKALPKSYRFDGLLVGDGETGYLFLHDGSTVRKAIAGYSDYLRQLFTSGFGVC